MKATQTRPQQRSCIYCGHPVVKVRRGDHIMPEALGGTKTLKTVCQSCNGKFSELENELIGKTPLAILAARELGRSMANVWDVDTHDRNLLLEARRDEEAQSMMLYPQLIFDDAGLTIRFDYEEGLKFGIGRFCHLFSKRVKRAFEKTIHNEKGGFHGTRIPSPLDFPGGYRYPPRVFARGSMSEAAYSKTLELTYTHAADRRRVYREISRWTDIPRFHEGSSRESTLVPVVRARFNRASVVRGLWKIGFNILAFLGEKTLVDYRSFKHVTDAVRGISQPNLEWLDHNGFVPAMYFDDLSGSSNCHRVEVSWSDDKWRVRFAFFGGNFCAVVYFDGPNNETWNTVDLTIPIHSDDWEITPSKILMARAQIPIEWGDLDRLVPSEQFVNSRILV